MSFPTAPTIVDGTLVNPSLPLAPVKLSLPITDVKVSFPTAPTIVDGTLVNPSLPLAPFIESWLFL